MPYANLASKVVYLKLHGLIFGLKLTELFLGMFGRLSLHAKYGIVFVRFNISYFLNFPFYYRKYSKNFIQNFMNLFFTSCWTNRRSTDPFCQCPLSSFSTDH